MTAPTLSPPDAWATVTRAQSGDPDAFAELYERYRLTVWRFVWFRTGNRQITEDIAQEVWVRALRNLPRVEYRGQDFGAWLVTIARNLVADYFKSGRYRLEVTTGDVLDADRVATDDPESSTANYLDSRVLVAAMQRLNDEQRTVLELRFLRGYSTEETALQMGKNTGAIKALQYRAIRSLARNPKVQALAVTG